MEYRALSRTLWVSIVIYSAIECTLLANASANESIDPASLKKLSLEELMNIEVESVTRTEERVGDVAAAVSVVTSETIRRTGAMSVPEALRNVQGLHVAAETANSWAVSSRGFSSVSSEKLLVLSDTRSIYTPLYSGVFWDVQDYLMEDIDRIEVVRGPGAALWGSNAVNGIINITTRSARDTQGFYAEAGAGNEERGFAGVRYGGQTGNGLYFRVFGKYFDRDGSFSANSVTSDDAQLAHAGFRMDVDTSSYDSLTLQGDVYDGSIGRLRPSVNIIGRPGPQGNLEADVSGGNVLGRWRRSFSADADMQVRAYYDHTYRNDPSYRDTLDTVDIDFQHRFPMVALRQQIIWGLNYRRTDNRNQGKIIFNLDPADSIDTVASAFVQDQIPIIDSVRVTLGSKFEHNDFSEFEIQPSANVVWNVSQSKTWWAAVSRAVRIPTRLERDISIDVTDPNGNPVLRLLGNKQFDSEELLAYETGYRWQPTATLYMSVAAYYNRYHGLSSLELGTPFVDAPSGKTIVPVVNLNRTSGVAKGVETQITYSPVQRWQFTFVHTYTDLNLETNGLDLNRGRFLEGSTPKHQFGLRSSLDLPHDIQFDAQLRRLGDIESIPAIVSGEGLPGYTELDVRLAWLTQNNLEFALIGKNLLHDHHIEFGDLGTRGELERSLFGKITWRL